MKYKVNDIVNVHSYDLRLIGKIIHIGMNKFGFTSVIVKTKNSKLFEICEQDITMKLGEAKNV